MPWFNSHCRFQEQLSAYIDAELPAKDALALDAHLQSCDACARELEELRLTSAALQELPELQAPHSFALSPADVALPRPQAGVRSVNAGMRLTGAGLAAALAVLLVLDARHGRRRGEDSRDAGGTSLSAAVTTADDEALKSAVAGRGALRRIRSADGTFTEAPTPETMGRRPQAASGKDDGLGSEPGTPVRDNEHAFSAAVRSSGDRTIPAPTDRDLDGAMRIPPETTRRCALPIVTPTP
jgi:hypothetical protein